MQSAAAASYMTVPPEARPEAGSPEHWLLHAKSDLRAGVVLRADSWVMSEQACFHFQQAAEKALKGVIVKSGVDYPRVHDINELLRVLTDIGLKVPKKVREADLLSPFAVQTRYPGDLPDIPDDEMDAAEHAATAAVTWAESKIVSKRRKPAPDPNAARRTLPIPRNRR